MAEPQFISEMNIPVARTDIHTQILRSALEIQGIKKKEISETPPDILKEVPAYELGDLVNMSLSIGHNPEHLGGGIHGDVYKIDFAPNLKCALKVSKKSGLSENKMLNLRKDTIPSKDEFRQVERQAAGLILSHSIEPDYTDTPLGLVYHKGQIVGVLLEMYGGEPKHFREAVDATGDNKFYSATEKLKNGGVILDDTVSGGKNCFVVDKKVIKIVDVVAEDDVLTIDPRNPGPKGFYIEEHKTVHDSAFDNDRYFTSGSIYTYKDISKKMERYKAVIAPESRQDLSFEDVCEGKAVVTTPEIVEKNMEIITRFGKVFDTLKQKWLDIDDEEYEFEIDEDSLTIYVGSKTLHIEVSGNGDITSKNELDELSKVL